MIKMIEVSQTIALAEIRVGDGIRVRSPAQSFRGEIVKVNRVTFQLASTVWGHPVEYRVRKRDCVGGFVDRGGRIMRISN